METLESEKINLKQVERLFMVVLNTRKWEEVEDILSEAFQGSGGSQDRAGFIQSMQAVVNGFPDIQWTLDDLMATEEKVAVRWTVTGTHTGYFNGFRPTGKRVSVQAMGIYGMKNGRIVQSWTVNDRLSLLQQIGVLPQKPAAVLSPSPECRVLIDRFIVPPQARDEFIQRMEYNRSLIRNLSGFVKDTVYSHEDESGNLHCVTVAIWENEAVLNQAKAAVQAEYRRIYFDPAEMFQRLSIRMERGIYQ
jgi:steroid delta-isomerase-like uncharacterized protein